MAALTQTRVSEGKQISKKFKKNEQQELIALGDLGMEYVRWLNEVGESDKKWAGEKAASLGGISRVGIEVPRSFCLSARIYDELFVAQGLIEKIVARLGAIDVSDPTLLEPTAEEIRRWIVEAPFPNEIERQVREMLDKMDCAFFAVRASRTLVDLPDAAYSGLQKAHLGVPASQVLDAIRRCWATPWNSHAIYLRHRKKIAPEQVSMAVLIQKMINADAAGVLFTASPSGGRLDEMHIDGVWGLGEAVNAARWKPDHYVLDKANGAIREKTIATKTVMQVVAPEGGLQTIGVPQERQTSPCLTDSQLSTLAEVGKKADAHFQSAQDIAWCRAEETIFVLQTHELIKKQKAVGV
jgi:phosphoenolpyruvate synthase/pyruvate phosphate dikinase